MNIFDDKIKEIYVFKYPSGKFAGMDQDSGGYPYETSTPGGIKFWYNLKDALDYGKMFKDLTLYKIEFKLEKVI